MVHTHASENRDEVELVRRLSGGFSNLEYLADTGLASPHLCVAHCVWVSDREQELLAARDIKVLHCPGSNLKLGSGIAPVAAHARPRDLRLARRGRRGLQQPARHVRRDPAGGRRFRRSTQPRALSRRVTRWSWRHAKAPAPSACERELGSVEPGKRADLILVRRDRPHLGPDPDPWSTLAYAARGTDVELTMVDGRILVRGGQLTELDGPAIVAASRTAAAELVSRAGI